LALASVVIFTEAFPVFLAFAIFALTVSPDVGEEADVVLLSLDVVEVFPDSLLQADSKANIKTIIPAVVNFKILNFMILFFNK
jgi:hypothetical protein